MRGQEDIGWDSCNVWGEVMSERHKYTLTWNFGTREKCPTLQHKRVERCVCVWVDWGRLGM